MNRVNRAPVKSGHRSDATAISREVYRACLMADQGPG